MDSAFSVMITLQCFATIKFRPDLRAIHYITLHHIRPKHTCKRTSGELRTQRARCWLATLLTLKHPFSPHYSLHVASAWAEDHPDALHSNTGGRIRGKPVFQLRLSPAGALILSWLEKGSCKCKKDTSSRTESLRFFDFLSLFVALRHTHSKHTGWVTSMACQPLRSSKCSSIP